MEHDPTHHLRQIRPGWPVPPGATAMPDGVNFSVFGPDVPALKLTLYAEPTDLTPLTTIELAPGVNRTNDWWHVFVKGVGPGICYGWEADTPLLDPWARTVIDALWNREEVRHGRPTRSNTFRARVEAEGAYDWEDDRPVLHPLEDSIIYELHVGGFTRHRSSSVSRPGTFGGLVEKVPYLVDLGVTDVELMPVMAFDPQDVPRETAGLGLSNFWGYSPYGFFATHPGYGAGPDPRKEFRDLVKALHRAGIGVILDVVFNHTAESDHKGPSIHFRRLANEIVYHLDPRNPSRYSNYTGCGNTLKCNRPFVVDFIVQSLEYWVEAMHVDGFRFDLASVLTRGEDGEPMERPPVIAAIEASPKLVGRKLIAEAWDAAGLYQVGRFPGTRWVEWNGLYRDTVRRAVRGDRGTVGDLATRMSGSSDLYQKQGRSPSASINFVTCHDGFTLWDLVSYEEKHNEANGQDNQDGEKENLSWNCGVEGPTDAPEVLGLRRRQARNCLAILFLSQGVPMLTAGDEFHRTQLGNNNAWCQDNAVSWINWSMAHRHSDMHRFVRELIALRKRHPSLRRREFLTGAPGTARLGQSDITWYGLTHAGPDWNDPHLSVLRFTLAGRDLPEGDLHIIINVSADPVGVVVPLPGNGRWHRALDTMLPSPLDITAPPDQDAIRPGRLTAGPHSVIVLESHAV